MITWSRWTYLKAAALAEARSSSFLADPPLHSQSCLGQVAGAVPGAETWPLLETGGAARVSSLVLFPRPTGVLVGWGLGFGPLGWSVPCPGPRSPWIFSSSTLNCLGAERGAYRAEGCCVSWALLMKHLKETLQQQNRAKTFHPITSRFYNMEPRVGKGLAQMHTARPALETVFDST